MIVRVSGEDQYRLDESHHDRLNELDAAVIAAVEAGSETSFDSAFRALLEFVRTNGTRVGDEEIEHVHRRGAFCFVAASGERILLAPGQTWVHMVPNDWVVTSR